MRDYPVRKYVDTALLYYTLARVSIENDEMMQDGPERALNKLFASMVKLIPTIDATKSLTEDVLLQKKAKHSTENIHVKTIFSLQQAILDGLEYLEENKREPPIWGIPPLPNHRVQFHPEHTPPLIIQKHINYEMKLVDEAFQTIISHWRSLKDKVARHLDVLIQFRVLEQQELAVKQRELAVEQQNLATLEAKNSRLQSRSIMLFTAITIVFLPLSFFTSYFGMNFTDIRETKEDSGFFWMISGPISMCILVGVFCATRYMKRFKRSELHIYETGESDIEAARHTEEERRYWIGSRAGISKLVEEVWRRLWKSKRS